MFSWFILIFLFFSFTQLAAFPPLHFTANRDRESIFAGECAFVQLAHRLVHTRATLDAERPMTLLMRQMVLAYLLFLQSVSDFLFYMLVCLL